MFLLFSSLLLICGVLTLVLTSITLRNEMIKHLQLKDRYSSQLLAFQVNQIVSETPKEDFQNYYRAYFHEVKHGETFPKLLERNFFAKDFSRHKLQSFRSLHYGESIEAVLDILVNEHFFLFFRGRVKKEEDFFQRPSVLYQNSTDGSLDSSWENASDLYIRGRVYGKILVNSMKDHKLRGMDSNFLKILIRSIFLALSLVLLLAGVVAFFFIRRITRPISQLKDVAEEIAKGNFDSKVPVLNHDELTDLAIAFNTMGEQLMDLESSRKEMIADISHELRTPVALMGTRLEMMICGQYSMDSQNLLKMEKNLQQLSSLIDKIHEISVLDSKLIERKFKGKSQEIITLIDLEQLIGDLYEEFADTAELRQISLRMKIQCENPKFSGDLQLSKGALKNLIINALKYVEDGGRILTQITKDENFLLIEVMDDGCGVEKIYLDKIFNRFFRVDQSRTRSSGGSGLGLALVKGWVDSMGGEVSAINNEWGGLTVRIKLFL